MGKIAEVATLGLVKEEDLLGNPNAGAGAAAASAAQIAQAVKDIEALEIPDIEKQELQMQLMSEAGFMDAEELGPSGYEEISTDPRLRDAQMQALEQLRERGEVGLTEEEKAQREQLKRGIAADANAQQQSILQQMEERGALDSGAQLAAQLASQQGSYDRASQEALNMSAANEAARRDALERAASSAGQIRSQDYGEQAQAAQAKDMIKQFNAQNRQNVAGQNLGIKQQDVGLKNQEQMYNKGLIQQDFNNKMAKQNMVTNARTGQANNFMQQSQAQAQASQAKAAGNMALLSAGAQAATMASDKNVKENVSPIQNMLDKLTPYEYDYKEDSGYDDGEKHIGVMAQDLEKSDLGSEFVDKDTEGTKTVDYGQMASTLLASNVDLHKRIKALEKKLRGE